jgi:hypothetical protein
MIWGVVLVSFDRATAAAAADWAGIIFALGWYGKLHHTGLDWPSPNTGIGTSRMLNVEKLSARYEVKRHSTEAADGAWQWKQYCRRTEPMANRLESARIGSNRSEISALHNRIESNPNREFLWPNPTQPKIQ